MIRNLVFDDDDDEGDGGDDFLSAFNKLMKFCKVIYLFSSHGHHRIRRRGGK